MKKTITALVCVGLVSACAQNASTVEAAYVPQSLYASESCSGLKEERNKVSYEVSRLTTSQNKKANTDAAAVAGGIIFWPALFVLAKDAGNTPELAEAKGRYDAIERQAKTKSCW